jgi:hypothetical protein
MPHAVGQPRADACRSPRNQNPWAARERARGFETERFAQTVVSKLWALRGMVNKINALFSSYRVRTRSQKFQRLRARENFGAASNI